MFVKDRSPISVWFVFTLIVDPEFECALNTVNVTKPFIHSKQQKMRASSYNNKYG